MSHRKFERKLLSSTAIACAVAALLVQGHPLHKPCWQPILQQTY